MEIISINNGIFIWKKTFAIKYLLFHFLFLNIFKIKQIANNKIQLEN